MSPHAFPVVTVSSGIDSPDPNDPFRKQKGSAMDQQLRYVYQLCPPAAGSIYRLSGKPA